MVKSYATIYLKRDGKIMIDNSKIYNVNHPEFDEPFNYIIKYIGAEVHGHGKKTT